MRERNHRRELAGRVLSTPGERGVPAGMGFTPEPVNGARGKQYGTGQ